MSLVIIPSLTSLVSCQPSEIFDWYSLIDDYFPFKDILTEAAKYISDEEGKEVKSADEAVAGALDIIAEQISDVADYRTYIRDITFKEGKIVSAAKDADAESVYENYYDYSEALSTIPGHRILAINRGEDEKFLTVKVEAPVGEIEYTVVSVKND